MREASKQKLETPFCLRLIPMDGYANWIDTLSLRTLCDTDSSENKISCFIAFMRHQTFCIFVFVETLSLSSQPVQLDRQTEDMQILVLAECFAWCTHLSPFLESVRPGSVSVPELQRQRLSLLKDRAFVLTAILLRNAR